jgi:hypothetical protein
MPAPTLVRQTTYAELLERCASAAFREAFPEDGAFTSKTIKERRYWYFQTSSEQGRTQRYVGPETPELLERISHHKDARDDERERRALVSTLVRSFGLQRPIPEIGDVVAALAKAGVFRLRAVLVGTVAYQTYSAMLGEILPGAIVQTGDVDIAQYKNVSVAIEDNTPPILDVLHEVDKTFRAIPHMHDGRRTVSYAAKGGLRVDFLTPNEGAETDAPMRLPALQTDAQPLRFLDFLIHDPTPAVVLHGAGIYVHVPAPERYAVHKLIISRRRIEGVAKRDKDVHQAGALLELLAQKRAEELKTAWHEASQRGKTWRQLLTQGLAQLDQQSRDITLKAVEEPRTIVPGLDLIFHSSPAKYDPLRDVVTFEGEALKSKVQCAISREALDDDAGADALDNNKRLELFLAHRSEYEALARTKYLSWPVGEPGTVLVKTRDIQQLRKQQEDQNAGRKKAGPKNA